MAVHTARGIERLCQLSINDVDDACAFRPFIETYTSEKLTRPATGTVHAFECFPPPANFPTLAGRSRLNACIARQRAAAGAFALSPPTTTAVIATLEL